LFDDLGSIRKILWRVPWGSCPQGTLQRIFLILPRLSQKNKQDPEVIIVANKIAGSKIFRKNKSDFYGAYIVLACRLSLVVLAALEQSYAQVRAET
jgi:hypothetical protein